ncbi:MAG: UDP-N-acetylenolpyruvoylglucosamine reductase, partial [Thomasclavelia spiroformis]
MKFSQVKIDLEMLDVGSIIEDEPLYKHTTYKVGGPARIYLKVKDIDSLVKTIKYCRKHRVKHMIIGRGSNLLFSDKEYEGVI